MTRKEIEERLRSALSITTLNPMQEAMAALKVPAKALLLSPTGSGKTVAFAMAMLRAMPAQGGKGIKGVVIAPSRELVLQISDVLRAICAGVYKVSALYGGHRMETEVASLGGNPDVVVATPGRLLDHLRRGNLSLFGADVLVLDEYDKSLELGFHEEMKAIVGRMRNARTLLLTSATAAAAIPDFVDDAGMHRMDFSGTTGDSSAAPAIEVFRVESPAADKLDTLVELLKSLGGVRTIVFVNHRDAAERVFDHLKRLGFPAGLYHGGLEQQYRERALVLFENGTTPILVSTDLASRGLDIDGVDAVIHYHLPPTPESWTHRNGRTARMGASGQAFAIISAADKVPAHVATEAGTYTPAGGTIAKAPNATLYINAGKKEKISRGDIAGFLIAKGGLAPDEVGKIAVKDHGAYVAVPAAKARETAVALAPHKIKNVRVRVTQLKPGDPK